MTGEKDIPALPYHGNNPFLSSTMGRLQNCAIAFLFPPRNRIVCVLQLHIALCAVHGTGSSMRKLYQTTLITSVIGFFYPHLGENQDLPV